MLHPLRLSRLSIALFFLLLGAASAALADDLDCSRITLGAQVERCAQLDKDRADAALNASYQALLGRLQHQYQSQPLLEQDYLGKLKNAQRAWIKYRDTSCVVEAFEVQPGTPAHTTLINTCVSRLSRERARDLDRWLPECCS